MLALPHAHNHTTGTAYRYVCGLVLHALWRVRQAAFQSVCDDKTAWRLLPPDLLVAPLRLLLPVRRPREGDFDRLTVHGVAHEQVSFGQARHR